MKNYILKNENAIFYECKYSCDNCIYINLENEKFFITDARYDTDVKENIDKSCQVIISNDLVKEAREILTKSKIKKIDFDPNDFSFSTYFALTKDLKLKFMQKPNFSKLKRIVKSKEEIKLIRTAMQTARLGFEKFQAYLRDEGKNKSEQHLAYMAQTFLGDYGKYEMSFDPIIAINENASKPHAIPTQKKYKDDSLLLFDGGIKYERYCSDRTVTFGNDLELITNKQRKQKFKNKKHQKVYDTVLKAQETTIEKASVGMKASNIDKIGRDIIDKAGFGKYFIHSTGHGVGLDIHEYPNISAKSDFIIEQDMVYTIEPGIYLPNELGVRIEDTVLMKEKKAVIL